ncbi:hypothetical protein [Streptomyces sp. NPDC005568]|uniref:hypothetical protein n=1 Tax=Streptomyces sp. NPDC005568 TaxID=3156887 RepID=UPI0033A8C36A
MLFRELVEVAPDRRRRHLQVQRAHGGRFGLHPGWKYTYDPTGRTGGGPRWPWSKPDAGGPPGTPGGPEHGATPGGKPDDADE